MAERNENTLQYAEQLLRGNRNQEARVVLAEYLQNNSSSAHGWWLLSFAVADTKQRIECLERVLRIDPNYASAQSRLLTLKADGAPKKPPEIIEQIAPVKQEVTDSPTDDVQPVPAAAPIKKKTSLIWLFAFLSICVVLGAIAFFTATTIPLQTAFSFMLQPSMTPVNTIPPQTLPPTWTPASTNTPVPSKTPEPATPTPELELPNSSGWLATGKEAPDFTMENITTGQEISLSDYRGRPVILFFFVTWCDACDAEVPALKKIYEDYKDDGLVVLAIDEKESAAKAISFRDMYDLPFPIINDQDGSILRLYKGTRYPTNYFIDLEGKVSTSVRGMMDYPALNIRVLVLLNRISTPVP